jgi:hypothetical protein
MDHILHIDIYMQCGAPKLLQSCIHALHAHDLRDLGFVITLKAYLYTSFSLTALLHLFGVLSFPH